VPADPVLIDPNGGLANAWTFQYSYSTVQAAGSIRYELTRFVPSMSDLTPVGLVEAGELPAIPTGQLAVMKLDLTRYGFRLDPTELWLRVIAYGIYGNPIAVSNAVHIVYGKISSPTLQIGPQHPSVPTVQLRKVGIPDENYQYWFEYTQPVSITLFGKPQTVATVGQEVYIPPKTSSWFDDLCDAVSSAISWIADAWNWVAHEYNALKTGIVNLAASALPGCDDTCKSLLGDALDAGLVMVGMPPSLPDSQELVSDFGDYIEQQMTDGMNLPLPDGWANALVSNTVQQFKQANQNGGNPAAYLKPAHDKQYRSGVLLVTLQNPSSTDAVPMGSLTVVDESGRWNPAMVQYAGVPKGGTLTVPVVLVPSTAYTNFQDVFASCMRQSTIGALGPCLQAKDNAYASWKALYSTGFATFRISSTVAGMNGTGGQLQTYGLVTVDVSQDLVTTPTNFPSGY